MTRIRTAALSICLFFMSISQLTFAHSDSEAIWEMNRAELTELEKSIEPFRRELVSALAEATTIGVDPATLTRPYRYDSDMMVANVPRSVLNRVIVASMELEIETMRSYIFCDGCEHSLLKDLADHPKRTEAVTLVRRIWPFIKGSFRLLFKEIPISVWARTIHTSNYLRSVRAAARYQSNAYGTVSMVAGTAAFGTMFAATEMVETAYAGPLHLVCKANYFWSVAVGTAVSSFAREFKTLLAFEKDGKTLLSRLQQAFLNFSDLRSLQKLEKRVLFHTLLSEEGLSAFKKLSRRDSHSGLLEPLLEKMSATQAIAADGLMWSELIAVLYRDELENRIPSTEREKLFDQELERLFAVDANAITARLRWQDLSGSLRVILRAFYNSSAVRHQLHQNQADVLRLLGRLDLELRTLDLFVFSWLANHDAKLEDPRRSTEAANWIRNMVSEWLTLSILVSSAAIDAKSIEIRLQHFASVLKASIRRGAPLDIAPEGARGLASTLQRERYLLKSDRHSDRRLCEELFAIAR